MKVCEIWGENSLGTKRSRMPFIGRRSDPEGRVSRMSFFWIALLNLMVVVMGHGGDGGNKPPHQFSRGFNDHQINVPPKRKGMATLFDFGAITNYPMGPVYWASLNNRICAQYRGLKNVAKTRLTGSEGVVEVERAQAPTVKQNLNSIEAFHRGHVNKQVEFFDHLVVDQYVALQTHHIVGSSSDLDTIDWIAIFEKMLGTRRGHVRGIGPKPSSATAEKTSIGDRKGNTNNDNRDDSDLLATTGIRYGAICDDNGVLATRSSKERNERGGRLESSAVAGDNEEGWCRSPTITPSLFLFPIRNQNTHEREAVSVADQRMCHRCSIGPMKEE
ncbi:unnamed protein product [Lactuca saligna]|uniref:Uncharacterized protein n=1 Tax=Lactuca saligna TaxID=75948 RepID=A0AA36EE00_LACSI|nr:unnamed protein product [Lactuca saligna]